MDRERPSSSRLARRLRKLLIAMLAIGLAAGIVAAVRPIAERLIKERIEWRLARMFGGPVHVGTLELTWGGLMAEDVRAGPPTGAYALTVGRVRAAFPWHEVVLGHALRVSSLAVEGAEVRIVDDGTGAAWRPIAGVGVLFERAGIGRVAITRSALIVATPQGQPLLAVRELDGELMGEGGGLALRARAEAMDSAGRLGSVMIASRLDGGELTIESLNAEGGGARVSGRAVVRLDAPGAPFAGSLTAELDTQALADLSSWILAAVPQGDAWRARRAQLTLRVTGKLVALRDCWGEGSFTVEELDVPPAPSVPPVHLRRLAGEISRRPGAIELRRLVATGEGLRIAMSLELTGPPSGPPAAFRAKGSARFASMKVLRRATPKLDLWRWIAFEPDGEPAQLGFRATGALPAGGHRETRGHFTVQRFAVRARQTRGRREPLRFTVDRAVGDYAYTWRRSSDEAGRLLLRELTIEGPAGRVRGEADLVGRRHRLALSIERGDPAFLAHLLPGTLSGGTLVGTVVLHGDAQTPVAEAHGHVRLTGARYAPDGSPFAGRPIGIASLEADFARAGERLELSQLALESELGSARGRVTVAAAGAEVALDITTRDAGRLVAWHPAAANIVTGGAGWLHLEASFAGTSVRGRLDAGLTGGRMRFGAGSAAHAYPMDSLRVRLGFDERGGTISTFVLDGPEISVAGRGSWLHGRVVGTGRLRLSARYTAQLAGRWRLLARAAGMGHIATDFVLAGTTRRAVMQASIARSTRWKLFARVVPERLRDLARGRVPLWEVRKVAAEAAASPRSLRPAALRPAALRPAGPGAAVPSPAARTVSARRGSNSVR